MMLVRPDHRCMCNNGVESFDPRRHGRKHWLHGSFGNPARAILFIREKVAAPPMDHQVFAIGTIRSAGLSCRSRAWPRVLAPRRPAIALALRQPGVSSLKGPDRPAMPSPPRCCLVIADQEEIVCMRGPA